MTETDRLKYLRIALLFGRDLGRRNLSSDDHLAIWLVVAHGPAEYLQMILGIFATLGVHRSSSNRTAAGRHRRWRRTRDGERLKVGYGDVRASIFWSPSADCWPGVDSCRC
jgi:hypothetical protein